MHQDQYIAHVAQLMDDLDIISFVIPAPYLYHTCIILSSFLPAQESRVIDQDDTQQESFAVSTVGPKIRIDKNPYAILALGGYGRKEQCLHSDIDVILLFKKGLPREANALVQEIFYNFW